jgi:hypothetical protein
MPVNPTYSEGREIVSLRSSSDSKTKYKKRERAGVVEHLGSVVRSCV